jgi:hypothetical protein
MGVTVLLQDALRGVSHRRIRIPPSILVRVAIVQIDEPSGTHARQYRLHAFPSVAAVDNREVKRRTLKISYAKVVYVLSKSHVRVTQLKVGQTLNHPPMPRRIVFD